MTYADYTDARQPDAQPVFRFAPSPNGPLHRGHALSALLNGELARRMSVRFLLRIEDIDPERSKPEHCAAIEDALEWLGLQWERPVRRQSEHMDDYARAFAALRARGVVYPCFCTRGEIVRSVADIEASGHGWPRDPDGAPLYPRRCRSLGTDEADRRLAAGERAQWRLDVAKALTVTGPIRWRTFDPATGRSTERIARPERWGDCVIVRRDTPTSYHLSVVVDDALQGVSHVVRGIDLEAATDIHALLQALLGLPSPLYLHHDLINDPEGRKLSKSKGSVSLQFEREHGLTVAALRAQVLPHPLF